MYKISVIIPVYNAENTINKAIDSILNQNWRGNLVEDIEVVAVDDKSSDGTIRILSDYADKYPNVKTIFLDKNSGHPSHPRNVGIKNADAEYVMFLDNDDEYCENFCQTIFDAITLKDVDVATCNWYNVLGSKIEKIKLDLNYEELQHDEEYLIVDSLNAILADDWMIWKSIYKKSFLIDNNIFFPLQVCEDVLFLINAYLTMNKMIYINNFYGYKRNFRGDSLSAVPKANVILEYLDAFFDVQELLESSIDFEKKGLDKFYFLRKQIDSNLFKIILLEKTEEKNICLDKLYELESRFQFDNSIPKSSFSPVMKTINFFVLKNRRKLTIFLIRLSQIFLKFVYTFIIRESPLMIK